jgi:hypothetical protein
LNIACFALSFFYFYGGPFGSSPKNPEWEALEKIIIQPAFVTFGFRYGAGEGPAYIAGFVIILIIWIILFYITQTLAPAIRKKKARSHNNG